MKTKSIADLEQSVEAFRLAQFSANADILKKLCLPELSYSHLNGKIEDKETFVTNATNGRFVFDFLDFKHLTNCIVDSSAITRFELTARQTWKDGLVTDTHMSILMAWVWQNDAWYLLARSATKLN
jgi:hypothetical protein